MARRNLILLLAAVILASIPLFMSFEGEKVFGGADGQAQDAADAVPPRTDLLERPGERIPGGVASVNRIRGGARRVVVADGRNEGLVLGRDRGRNRRRCLRGRRVERRCQVLAGERPRSDDPDITLEAFLSWCASQPRARPLAAAGSGVA